MMMDIKLYSVVNILFSRSLVSSVCVKILKKGMRGQCDVACPFFALSISDAYYSRKTNVPVRVVILLLLHFLLVTLLPTLTGALLLRLLLCLVFVLAPRLDRHYLPRAHFILYVCVCVLGRVVQLQSLFVFLNKRTV